MADVRSGGRKRAVGTRDRVMSHLIAIGEVRDGGGMASTVLAEAVGYPGSSVAFAQLLSGMERSGLIDREIRGKRTYRIAPTAAAAAGGDGSAGGGGTAGGGTTGGRSGKSRTAAVATRGSRPVPIDGPGALVTAGPGEVDYDELARRLLIQVVQRLASAPTELEPERVTPSPAGGEATGDGAGDAELAQTVASLEQKLASVRSKQRKLTAENARLREQLQAAQRSLAQAQAQERTGSGQLTGQLDTAEVRLLERLLSPLRQQRDRREEADAG